MRQKQFLFSGSCVMESYELTRNIAIKLKTISDRLGYDLYFKMMFDKSNRSSLDSYRGPGLELGIEWMKEIKEEIGIKIFTDVHESYQCEIVKNFVDVIQIPAFLCKQTDLVINAAKTGKKINVKKGQFVTPYEMKNILNKIRRFSSAEVFFTERGSVFGYGDTIVDMRSLQIMNDLGVNVLFDGTHSVLRPAAFGSTSGGQSEFSYSLLRAAAAVGVDGYFLEVHPAPSNALCDGHSMTSINKLENILVTLKNINSTIINKI
ncbi:MAG: 3-deoxy-8-phosphooctulonate synthase [Spirochaetales bacterium]|nr:3-deoxy-8-phosphooctulonate synthase [Spirochaetales bacterium]